MEFTALLILSVIHYLLSVEANKLRRSRVFGTNALERDDAKSKIKRNITGLAPEEIERKSLNDQNPSSQCGERVNVPPRILLCEGAYYIPRNEHPLRPILDHIRPQTCFRVEDQYSIIWTVFQSESIDRPRCLKKKKP
jgi:hypothetical protein